jgi:peptidyl-prolyl cis-trans isomerase B (cyclophilin B)
MVRIEMENGGIIDIELYEDKAPITVKNFKKLVSEGFYDGLIFHRVIAGFMIQGGDPTGTGCGGSDENIKGEFMINGVPNTLSHVRGVISMARSQSYNSASSQFFICHADAKFLDGQYAGFGKVVNGIEVVDEIANVKTDMRDRPVIDMRMKRVTLVD